MSPGRLEILNLKSPQTMLCQLATVKARLGLLETDNTADALLTAALEALTVRFDQEANRTFARTENATYEFDPHDREIAVPAYPLEFVTRFEVKTSEAEGWVEQGEVEYFIRHNCLITLRASFAVLQSAFCVPRVVYTGGYVLPGDPVPVPPLNCPLPVRLPPNVEQAAVEQVAFWYQYWTTADQESVLNGMQNIRIADKGPVKGRVFSYLRWSCDSQSWGDSERRQNDLAEAWCSQHGLSLSGQAKDEGVSAFKGANRRSGSGLDRLLSQMEAGDTLLVEDSDRWSRENPLDSLNALRDTVNKGVRIVLLRLGIEITKDNFNNPEVLFPSFFASYLANAESAKKSVRVKASWDARITAVKQGKPINQNLPSWLRWNRETKNVELIKERAETVKKIFDLYLETGSIRKVTRNLVALSVPCISKRKRSAWANSYVHQILTNRAVIGDCLHTKPATPNIFPKIVPDYKFFAVAERLRVGRHFTATTRKAANNLFTGIARCSRCGSPMNMNSFRRPRKTMRYLACGAAMHDRLDCVKIGIRYEQVEDCVLGLLIQEDAIREALHGPRTEPTKIEMLRVKMADCHNRQEKILHLIEGEANPTKILLRKLQALESEEAGLQAEMSAETAMLNAQTSPEQAYASLRQQLRDPQITISNRSHFRELLRGLLDKIIINTVEKELTIFFKGGKAPWRVKLFASGIKP